ncbi:hypothetical protein [Oceanicoccus sagamiensis]|uniref:DUF2834 domain-containing protein n=1 Tax=Oceanicoccus sagamiensis TaxID=716816 RepID=A0A1X9NA24_9GAMM|nr:hypothetical protein [Oceanicoccus sagamiensis]ARN74021.1 hypothetical protein BST96_07755 [Oceanicoccus sagamiensis]
MKKILLAVLWVVGWVHVFFFSPEDNSPMMDFIVAVMDNNTELVDPMVFMVFNLLGVWPLIMVAMLVQDNQGKLKAWPFAFSSMVLGNSALYLYLFARRDQAGHIAKKTPLVRFAESKILALLLLASTLALWVYGLSEGSFAAYSATWQVNFFVNVMTIDFFLFAFAFAAILADDMRRRQMPVNGLFWLYVMVPVLGATCYLMVRKPLPDNPS